MDVEVGTVKAHLFRAVNAVRKASEERITSVRICRASGEHGN
jgi:DNA-directed RNA polymerase specialized sigma24 family protein